jgi:hypothetical protein
MYYENVKKKTDARFLFSKSIVVEIDRIIISRFSFAKREILIINIGEPL